MIEITDVNPMKTNGLDLALIAIFQKMYLNKDLQDDINE